MTVTKGIGGAAALAVALLLGPQTSHAEYDEGKLCHATAKNGDKVYRGKYNDEKECCSAKDSSGHKLCIVCDNPDNICGDGYDE
jgi:hypothetical protein